MNRERGLYWVNACLCAINGGLWFAYTEVKLIAYAFVAVAAVSLYLAIRLRDPYFYRGG